MTWEQIKIKYNLHYFDSACELLNALKWGDMDKQTEKRYRAALSEAENFQE